MMLVGAFAARHFLGKDKAMLGFSSITAIAGAIFMFRSV
jgi:hypothetical protein